MHDQMNPVIIASVKLNLNPNIYNLVINSNGKYGYVSTSEGLIVIDA